MGISGQNNTILFPKLNQIPSRQVDRHTLHIAGLFTLCFDNTLNVKLAKRDFFVKEVAEVAIMTGVLVARLNHFFLAHLTCVLHAESVQTGDLLVKVVQDDELDVLYVVSALYHRSMHVLATQTHVVGIIALASLATEYPVELLYTIVTAYQDGIVGVLFQIVHGQEILGNFVVGTGFDNGHHHFRQCAWVGTQFTFCHVKGILQFKQHLLVLFLQSGF